MDNLSDVQEQLVESTQPLSKNISVASSAKIHHGRFAIADALRATAIFAVVFSHLISRTAPRIHGHTLHLWRLGNWGVDTFFLLTGFLLARPFLEAIIDGQPLPSTKKFFIRRILRIVPLYLVALAFSVALNWMLGQKPEIYDIGIHALFLQDFSVKTVQTINGPLWTMPVDFEFYIAMPLLAALTIKCMPSRFRSSPVALFAGLTIGTLGSIGYRFVVSPHIAPSAEATQVYLSNGIGMAACLFTGISLALIVREATHISD